jgi:signal transduction histidine kinase
MALPEKPSHEFLTILSGLAHELDSPLQSISKSTQKLIDEYKRRDFEYLSYKDFTKIITTLEQMNRQLKRCCATTGRMLVRSSTGSCAINEVIREITALLKQQIKAAGIKMSLRLAKDIPPVRLGKVECHQVIHNVLVNAMQAMPAGGAVRIRTARDRLNKRAVVEVQDEGVGITPEHLSKIFEPFFTTKERGFEKSAGLGLSVVHAIVEKAGGGIHIKSSLRTGTIVRIDLPLAAVSKS